jgi:hypothetical protein
MTLAPMRMGILQCEHAPAGLLILGGSFVLFALGTIVAFTKDRWMPRRSTAAMQEGMTS